MKTITITITKTQIDCLQVQSGQSVIYLHLLNMKYYENFFSKINKQHIGWVGV